MYKCNSQNQNIMPIPLAAITSGLGALQQSKIDRALSGEKTYTRPKTIFGKLIGGVSGRTAAAQTSAQTKTSPLTEKEINSFAGQAAPNRQSVPVTGGISFGGEAIKRSYLPFYLGAIVLGIFFFMRRRGGRRRR